MRVVCLMTTTIGANVFIDIKQVDLRLAFERFVGDVQRGRAAHP